MKSYAHSEFAVFSDVNLIKENIEQRKFFIDPNKNLKVVPIDNSFPTYIRLNQKKYSDWII